jgi:hypothetical protein
MALTHIEAVFIEADPYSSRAEPGVVDSPYSDLPEAFLDALAELYVNRDSVTCWRCNEMTGYVLAEQPSGFEGVEWRPTGLAREVDGPVAVLCEECAPYIPPVGYKTARLEFAASMTAGGN